VVLLSNFGLGCDYLLMAVAPSLRWLLIGRIISGITSASVPTASAYIADITPERERAAKFGMLGAAFGLGFIIGPALGGVLGNINLRYPFWAAAVLSLANALYGFVILPESLSAENRSRFSLSKANPIASLRLLESHPKLFGLAAASFFYYIAHESLPSIFPIYTLYRYHWSEGMTGLVLAGVGLCSAIVSAALVPQITRVMGERGTFFSGLLFGIIGVASFAAAQANPLVFAGCVFVSLFQITGPALQSMMSSLVGTSDQGKLQGAINSIFGIAGMVGPALFNKSFALAIAPHSRIPIPGTPFWLAALFLAVAAGVALYTSMRAHRPADSDGPRTCPFTGRRREAMAGEHPEYAAFHLEPVTSEPAEVELPS
jgi:DHA1 family tetracycline resistance protein-like MFS transporter